MSQSCEEPIIYASLLKQLLGRPGAFLEIGGFDGLTYTNSLALEICLGWTGALIERNPTNYAAGLRNRPSRAVAKWHGAV